MTLLTEHLTLSVNVYSCQYEDHYKSSEQVGRGPNPVTHFVITFNEIGSHYLVEATEHVSNNEGSLKSAHKRNGSYYGQKSHIYEIRCIAAPTKQGLFSHGHGEDHGLDAVEDLRKPDSFGC